MYEANPMAFIVEQAAVPPSPAANASWTCNPKACTSGLA